MMGATTMFGGICAWLLAGLAMLASVPATARETPGSYVNWKFDGSAGLSDVAYTITVLRDPGHGAEVFWSNQVGFGNGRGGYAGMQSNGGARRMFLFSVWDVTEYVAGEGSYCVAFGGEGVGVSCRRRSDWKAGDAYEFHYVAEGDGWWGMTVTNLADRTSFKLGSIKVGADTMNPDSVSWTEYFRWNDAQASCASEPFSRARFDAPRGDKGALTARIASTKVSAGCASYSSVATTAGSATHANAIGNSVMAPIAGDAGACLDMTGAGKVVSRSCRGGGNQRWVLAHDDTLRANDFTCATVGDGDSVRSGACTGGSRRTWRVDGTQLVEVSSGKCLTAGSGGVAVSACDGSASQQWNVPAREQ